MFSDERRYAQFIMNFLTNSIKFTPAGGEVTVIFKLISVSEEKDEDEDEEKKIIVHPYEENKDGSAFESDASKDD